MKEEAKPHVSGTDYMPSTRLHAFTDVLVYCNPDTPRERTTTCLPRDYMTSQGSPANKKQS